MAMMNFVARQSLGIFADVFFTATWQILSFLFSVKVSRLQFFVKGMAMPAPPTPSHYLFLSLFTFNRA
jgi:hypothetical protein